MVEDYCYHVMVRCTGCKDLRCIETTKDLKEADLLSSVLITLSLYDRVEIRREDVSFIKSFEK